MLHSHNMGKALRLLLPTALLTALSLVAQPPTGNSNNSQRPAEPPKEPGIPVRDDLTKQRCSPCHKADKDGNLTRISWVRTTPEGWQQAIKRMVRLNGLSLKPEEARHIVQYLSANHGLAPEEAAAINWFVEKRARDEESNIPSEEIKRACASCHPIAQPNSWRRSAEEWKLLTDMHVGYFPVTEFTAFRSFGRPQPGQPPQKHPVDLAIEHFSKANGLHTPEWANWKASMRPAKLQGQWILWGTQPGKGRVLGNVSIEPGANENEFTTSITFTDSTGKQSKRTGRANLYTGHAWRGRSTGGAGTLDDPKDMREVMSVSRDQSTIEGRWFWGGYEEMGINAKLVRAGESTLVLGLDTLALKSGTTSQVKIYGDKFSSAIKASDISFGNGITVQRVISATPRLITVEVVVAKDAIFGPRDVEVSRAVATKAAYVYDKVNYIKVSTDTTIARLGGNTHPKGYAQFEAIGYHNGLDGKPNTPDDLNLGPVPATWKMEEFLARFDDDDKDHVGTLNATTGLFTPASEGPNPKRKWGANNFGDVWVVATYTGGEKPLTARNFLIVTVPLYMRWDQPEVAE
jgi:quinohemoprotein amine dehydrogenase